MVRAQYPGHERTGDPRPPCLPGKRHGLPDRPPSHQRTRLPGRPHPGKSRGPAGGHMRMDARLGGKRQGQTAPERAPGPPSSGYPHRSLAAIPVRHASVDPATQRPTALQGATPRDQAETPRQREISQLTGRFRRVWQVLGSNQRRLSRRFYSPSLLPEVSAADQCIGCSKRVWGLPPSAMRPWAPDFGDHIGHGQGQKIHGRAGGSGYTNRPAQFPAPGLPLRDVRTMAPSSLGVLIP
jgi:hypothetical protein